MEHIIRSFTREVKIVEWYTVETTSLIGDRDGSDVSNFAELPSWKAAHDTWESAKQAGLDMLATFTNAKSFTIKHTFVKLSPAELDFIAAQEADLAAGTPFLPTQGGRLAAQGRTP